MISRLRKKNPANCAFRKVLAGAMYRLRPVGIRLNQTRVKQMLRILNMCHVWLVPFVFPFSSAMFLVHNMMGA